MKKKGIWLLALLLIIVPFTFTQSADLQQTVTILFTHDMHSHLEEYQTEDGPTGGFGRLKTKIDEIKQQRDSTFVVDGGDFSMGTLFQTVYETQAAELSMLGYLGYDATTLGNHEFDYRENGLTNMLISAKKNQQKLPALVCANIDWQNNTDEEDKKLANALDYYGSKPYTIIERDGTKVGIFGLFGEDADDCAPLSGLTFINCIDAAKDTVKKLKAEGAELIICLSHSGTNEDANKSEDEILAKEVSDIDLIISGHSHTTLQQPIVYGNTYIVSAGSYTENLGQIDLRKNKDGRYSFMGYCLHSLNESVSKDESVENKLTTYVNQINEQYLSQFGYTYGQTLCNNTIDFGTDKEIQESSGELAIGNLLSDAYVNAVKKAEGDTYKKVDLAVTASGVIRGTLPKGELTVNDAFNISSLGIGADKIPGYPLIDLYLTGRELYNMAEVDASVSSMMSSARLFASGGGWKTNTHRIFLSKVCDVWVNDEQGKKQSVEMDKLYRVVTNLYCGQMLGSVKDKSFGLLSLNPKDEEGKEITDFEKRIIHDQTGREVKEWNSVAWYLESMSSSGGVSSQYAATQGRKVVSTSFNLGELFSHPNKIVYVLCGIIVLLVIIIIVIIRVVKYKKKKKQ